MSNIIAAQNQINHAESSASTLKYIIKPNTHPHEPDNAIPTPQLWRRSPSKCIVIGCSQFRQGRVCGRHLHAPANVTLSHHVSG